MLFASLYELLCSVYMFADLNSILLKMLLSGLLLLFNALQDSGAEDSFHRRALKLMKEAPLIDG